MPRIRQGVTHRGHRPLGGRLRGGHARVQEAFSGLSVEAITAQKTTVANFRRGEGNDSPEY